jgi:hypothetical protein
MIDTKKNAPRFSEGQTDNLTGKPNVARSAQRAQLFSFEAQKIGTQAGPIVGESDEEEASRILAMVREVFPNATLIRTEDNPRRNSSNNYAANGQQLFAFADERNGHE